MKTEELKEMTERVKHDSYVRAYLQSPNWEERLLAIDKAVEICVRMVKEK